MKKLTMRDVKRHNKAIGYHFFDKETLEFWGSKIETELFNNHTFITSEDNFDRTKRLYTIRHYDKTNGKVKTIGEFQQFKNLDEAVKQALEYDETQEVR